MRKLFLLLIAFVILSFADAMAYYPNDRIVRRNGILIYETIGSMDCPVYLRDDYTGTITYKWYRKIRKFGNESPASTPTQEAKCEYVNGRLATYYPGDRSYVFRFFWSDDKINKIETYNKDGSDAGQSRYEYGYQYEDERDQVYINMGTLEGNKYTTYGRQKYLYNIVKSSSYQDEFILREIIETYSKRGNLEHTYNEHTGWLYKDGRVLLTTGNDIIFYRVRHTSTWPGRRNNGGEYWYINNSKYLIYECK